MKHVGFRPRFFCFEITKLVGFLVLSLQMNVQLNVLIPQHRGFGERHGTTKVGQV